MDVREIAALAALDDRARRAAGSLRAAVAEARDWTRSDWETAAGGLSGNGVRPMATDETQDEHEDDGSEIVLRGKGENGKASGRSVTTGDRRLGLVAAAVFVVVAVAGGFLALRDDRSPNLQAAQPGPSGYLVADWLPEGWGPLYAALNPRGGPGPAREGETVVYGDASREDPWTGPVLAAQRHTVDPDDWWIPAPDDVTNITIEGVPVFVEDNGDVITAGASEPIARDQYLAVTGYGFELEAVLEAVEHLTADPSVGAGGLPDGYEEIARGPVSAPILSMRYGSFDGLAVTYGQPDGDEPQIVLGQHPADSPGAAALVRLLTLEINSGFEVDITEVRGQEAHVLRLSDSTGSTTTTVQWYEPSLKMVVSVTAFDGNEETLDRFIESLRVASPEELDELLDQYDEPPSPFGDID